MSILLFLILPSTVLAATLMAFIYCARHWTDTRHFLKSGAAWSAVALAALSAPHYIGSIESMQARFTGILLDAVLFLPLWIIAMTGRSLDATLATDCWLFARANATAREAGVLTPVLVVAFLAYTAAMTLLLHIEPEQVPVLTMRDFVSLLLSQFGWAVAESIAYQGCFVLLALRVFKQRRAIAVGTVALIFTFQHVAGAETLARYVLVFPFGIALCVVFLRYGIFWTVALHWLASCSNELWVAKFRHVLSAV